MPYKELKTTRSEQGGFSILELTIAMMITLAIMVAASTLLASSLRTRARENTRSNALAAAQRALNIMSREVSNSGYGLSDNGIVVADSAGDSIRVRANLDNNNDLNGIDEDVRFILQPANSSNQIVRYDNSTGKRSVLATNISGMTLNYFNLAGVDVGYENAERMQIEIWVVLPEGPEQPASTVRLRSQVALRNAPGTLDQF